MENQRNNNYKSLLKGLSASNVVEMYIWIGGSFLSYYTAYNRARNGADLFSYIDDPAFFVAVLLLLFPIIFSLIFSNFPFAYLRARVETEAIKKQDQIENVVHKESIVLERRVFQKDLGIGDLSNSSVAELLSYYALSSKELSRNIFSRAGVYLLVGVIVSFSGLLFFYSSTAQSQPALASIFKSPNSQEALSILIVLIPKFGILFFIEFVAFFFLKQYRSAMDEFRYYEAIKRCREEVLALVRMAELNGKALDPLELLKSQAYFSRAGILEKNQSSEIVEARKLEKNELELLEKIITAIVHKK